MNGKQVWKGCWSLSFSSPQQGQSLLPHCRAAQEPQPCPLPFEPICFRNKYLLLNNQELNELSAISLKANIPEVEAVLNTDR